MAYKSQHVNSSMAKLMLNRFGWLKVKAGVAGRPRRQHKR
jgi:hypothetical protein